MANPFRTSLLASSPRQIRFASFHMASSSRAMRLSSSSSRRIRSRSASAPNVFRPNAPGFVLESPCLRIRKFDQRAAAAFDSPGKREFFWRGTLKMRSPPPPTGGLDLNARNNDGELPIDLARKPGMKQAIRDEPRRRMDHGHKRATKSKTDIPTQPHQLLHKMRGKKGRNLATSARISMKEQW